MALSIESLFCDTRHKKIIMLRRVLLLSVIMLNVVMQSVVASLRTIRTIRNVLFQCQNTTSTTIIIMTLLNMTINNVIHI